MHQNPHCVARCVRRRYLPLLCTKAFDFNWTSRRENARAEFQISGKIKFPRVAGTAPATHGIYIPMEFRGRRAEIEWMYTPIGTYVRDRRWITHALYVTYLVLFYFWSALTHSNPVTTYRSRTWSICLVLMRLFCAFQLIPLRERQADVREEAG